MNTISTISYRDIGTQVGQTITYTVDGMYERERLHTAYVRGVRGESPIPPRKVTRPIPFGRYIPSLLWAISTHVHEFDHRLYSFSLMDYFTSKELAHDNSDIHYFEVPGLLRSFNTSKRLGKMTAVVGGTELATQVPERLRREAQQFGVEISISDGHKENADRRKETITRADRLVVLSNFVKDSYLRAGVDEDRIRVITQAVDPDAYPAKETYQPDPFRALFVGSVNLLKGVPYLLQAWGELGWGNDEDAELQLCGNITSEIESVLDRYNFGNISTPGWVDPKPYYQEATVLAFPSLTEGFAKVILEAMSTGTPVIVSENSGAPDIIEDGREGFVVPTRDSNALAEKLQYFRDNPSEVERMGRNARETAEQYTWDRFVDEVIAFLDESV